MLEDPTFLSMAIGIAVIVIVGGVGLVMNSSFGKIAEERLEGLTRPGRGRTRERLEGLLLRPSAINLGGGNLWAKLLPNPENLNLLYEQADVNLKFNSFMAIVVGLGAVGVVLGLVFKFPIYTVPLAGIFLAVAARLNSSWKYLAKISRTANIR